MKIRGVELVRKRNVRGIECKFFFHCDACSLIEENFATDVADRLTEAVPKDRKFSIRTCAEFWSDIIDARDRIKRIEIVSPLGEGIVIYL